MRAADVIEVLTLLDEAGAQAWGSVLAGAGFLRVLRDWLPTALAVADAKGREIDLHPVTPTIDGGGDQRLPEDAAFHYPPPVLGVIGGRQVRCVDVETQVRCHLGYEPTDKDRNDMRRLRERFRIELPDPYRAV